MKNEILKDVKFIAACGLYCGACKSYIKGKCPGCKENVKALWCKIRSCCREKEIENCSSCCTFQDIKECKIYNNFIGRAIGFVTQTNRSRCIELIRQNGPDWFVSFMADNSFQSIPKKYIISD